MCLPLARSRQTIRRPGPRLLPCRRASPRGHRPAPLVGRAGRALLAAGGGRL